MATLEQFRRQVGMKIGMDYDNAGNERTLIDEWLNEGVREVLLRSHCYVATATMDTTADEWQYDLSSTIMVIKELYRDGDNQQMIRVTPQDILDYRRLSQSADSAVVRWAVQGANMLMLWPTPTEAYTLNMVFVPRPTEMSFDTHNPSDATYGGIPTEFHSAIRLWALAEAADYDDDSTSGYGRNYRQEFDQYMRGFVIPKLNKRAGALPAARLKRPSDAIVASGNSVDWG